MPAPFRRTLRSLEEDGLRPSLAGIITGGVLLIAWSSWFVLGSVRVWERGAARVEVDGAAQPVQTSVAGRVLHSNLELGRAVAAGEVLVELDARPEALAREEAARRRETALTQLEALRRELAAAESATRADRGASLAALDTARAKRREAEARTGLAREEERRLGVLHDAGHVGEMELLRVATDARTRQAAAEASALDVSRLQWALRTNASDRLVAIARLRRDVATLEGDERLASATMDRLAHEIERRTIKSPARGRLGAALMLREGAVVPEGERLCVVVPPGELRLVAELPQETAIGRVRAGQPARVRLTGFNWIEYGTLAAEVTSVGTEAKDGRVRAELRFASPPPAAIPMQHGLAATVDVEVERTSPATLVLRAAGRALSGARPDATPPAAQPASIGRAP